MTQAEPWLAALAAALVRRGVAADNARYIVREVATHLRDSGEDPAYAFGDADEYARTVVDSLHVAPVRRTHPGPIRLQATGITKRYGRRTVLAGIDLTVRAGQIAAIVGANGGGKTTLLRICAGLVSPDAGQVTVSGRLAYCPQDGGTADFLLPDEHYVLVGTGAGRTRDESRAAGRAWASELGWDSAATTLTRHLSGGTRQKLNLVMSTLTEPDVLLLDEPYQGFDRGTYLSFWDRLWMLRDRGTAIVVVTHLLNQRDQVDVLVDLTEGAR